MRVFIAIVIFAVRIAPLSAATPITYERLMRAMQAANAGDSSVAASLGIDLRAYNFTWDFRVGRELKQNVVAVSTMWESTFFLFGANGQLLSSISAPAELHSVELFDFDGDGDPEFITTQTVGSGTGVRFDDFVIYSSAGGSIKEIWRRPQYWYATERNGITVDDGEGWLRPESEKLVYLFRETKAGKTRRRTETYQFTKGRFVATR